MNANVNKAVWIIAALSLLLGLSIGQLHRQHHRIKNLEEKTFQKGVVLIGNSAEGLDHRQQSINAHRQMQEMRARLDLERSRLERERARLHRELEIFHRMEQKQMHRDFTRRKHIVIEE